MLIGHVLVLEKAVSLYIFMLNVWDERCVLIMVFVFVLGESGSMLCCLERMGNHRLFGHVVFIPC